MKKIDTLKLSKEMNDTLIHRTCVMRSGEYLAKYLIHQNRSVDAIRLLGRCSVHDISKIKNTEEFMSLASIIDEIDEMQNVEHHLSDKQKKAIMLHWKNNSHHPEYYDSPNDMSDLDILEMACDCHARSKQYSTSLKDYIRAQQEIRFKFDKEHFRKLRKYCLALEALTKCDDYSDILRDSTKLCFDLKDTTMESLESFDEAGYLDYISTDRLFLTKVDNSDFASVGYSVNLREDNSEIGFLSIKCNGYLEYKIYEGFRGQGYGHEALKQLIECTNMDVIYIVLKKDNDISIEAVLDLGFVFSSEDDNTVTYKYVKMVKRLKK